MEQVSLVARPYWWRNSKCFFSVGCYSKTLTNVIRYNHTGTQFFEIRKNRPLSRYVRWFDLTGRDSLWCHVRHTASPPQVNGDSQRDDPRLSAHQVSGGSDCGAVPHCTTHQRAEVHSGVQIQVRRYVLQVRKNQNRRQGLLTNQVSQIRSHDYVPP